MNECTVSSWEVIKKSKTALLEKELKEFLEQMDKVRGNRIPIKILQGMIVENKGERVPLKHLADMRIDQDFRLVVQTKNHQELVLVNKTIVNSDLGLELVQSEKNTSYFRLGLITKEIRQRLAQIIKEIVEKCKGVLRKIRDSIRNTIKKTKDFSNDQQHVYEKETDKIINEFQEKMNHAQKKKLSELGIEAK